MTTGLCEEYGENMQWVSGLLLAGLLLLPAGAWADDRSPEPAGQTAPEPFLQLRAHTLGLAPDPTLMMSPGLDLETARVFPGEESKAGTERPRAGEIYATVTVCGPDGVTRTYTYALGEEGKVVERIWGDLSGPSALDRLRRPPRP